MMTIDNIIILVDNYGLDIGELLSGFFEKRRNSLGLGGYELGGAFPILSV
tara:strand:- start:174 stop:323 length:150 start_codon:yes stop_codon:yes gene_type:complete